MPSIVRHGNGWRVQYREGGRGSPLLKSPTLPTKTAAAMEAQRITARLKARGPIAGLIPWAELVERYCLAHQDCTPGHLAKIRTTLLRLAQERTWTSAASVTPAAVAGIAPYHARILRALLAFADTLDQSVDRRAITAAKPKAPRRTPVALIDRATVAALIAAADAWHPADGLLIHLIATYGHRAESLCGLRWGDLDLDRGLIRLRVKSMDIVEHPLTPDTAARLRALGPGDPAAPVLVGHLGHPWKDGRTVAGWIGHSLRGAAGERAGVLDLRRYAITRMLDLTKGDARTVAAITGHRTPSLLLNLYARTNDQRKAALVSGLGDPQVIPGVS